MTENHMYPGRVVYFQIYIKENTRGFRSAGVFLMGVYLFMGNLLKALEKIDVFVIDFLWILY